MASSKENFPGLIRPPKSQGGLLQGGQNCIGKNRRALSAINANITGVLPPHPRAVVKRGALKEKNDSCSKNHVPVHRPVTRRFAAQVAVKEQHPSLEKVKPLVQSNSGTNCPEDCIIIDAIDEEDHKAMDEHDVPMFVQHTEAMLEEIDSMDVEVEMEEIDGDDDEPVVDIDCVDKKNVLAVTEYIDDIHDYYLKTERTSCVPPNYMACQSDINERMRGILIDWLIEVHYKFELMDETLYLMVNIIDRFLAVKAVLRKKLQLVGVTAMLLACKYEEVSVPIVDDLIFISDKAYCRKEILDMEKLMINTLQFNLSLPTPYPFIRRFLKAAQSDKKLEMLSFFMAELCLVSYEMLKFPPSLLAAAAVFTAQCTLSGCKQWSKTCMSYTSYSQDQLMECAKMMVDLHRRAGTEKLTGVHKKYSCSKYGHAAKIEPAHFLVDDGFF
ncbi:Cyclin-B2-3 [Striga hermonthica]|uniref:Cyclin-B2-3 n=1 Tax=Striga hermonthica TaxID=68872 RepID=A0A9N7RTU0_STRHE|nr:Cyclin-B2-3 [Striga hermonthica]